MLTRTYSLALLSTCLIGVNAIAAERLVVEPSELQLVGRESQRLAVSLLDENGAHVDVSKTATFVCESPDIVSVEAAVVTAKTNGSTQIIVRQGELSASIAVTVRYASAPHPVEFRTDVIASLSRGGCSQGACHGSPQGKNGFRLSLRGFQPDLDWRTLSREDHGRRVNPLEPAQSLLLQKALGAVSHQGGRRLRVKDLAYQKLLGWIREGRLASPLAPRLESLEVLPSNRRLQSGATTQQLVVRAHFEGREVRDVTELAVFTMAADDSTQISPSGLVEFTSTAESAVLVRYLDVIATVRLSYIETDPNYRYQGVEPANLVDERVFAKQRELQLNAADVADDAEFLRRVSLDLIGAIPTPDEAVRFLESEDPDKRSKLIDALLERPEYAQFWALKWADVMRGNRESISERGVHNFQRYLIRSFADDRPFDTVAGEVLTSMGNTIHDPAANFYRISRTPNEAAESFSQLLLGVRIRCARCHNHPYEAITQRDYFQLAAHFARVRVKGKRFGLDDEVVYLAPTGKVTMPGDNIPLTPAAFGVETGKLGDTADPRRGLAQWLAKDERRMFARSTVNRVWAHLLGQGIVEPVDDFRDSNPPSNPALLDALADVYVEEGYRFKPLIRLILNSHTYQLSSRTERRQSAKAANAERYFTRPIIKMLTAEQVLDAVSTATGVDEHFLGYPPGTKAIAVAEGGISHKFLQAFTKPARDVACDCARDSEPGLNQVVHLLNNPSLLDKIDSEQSRIARWIRDGASKQAIIQSIYLATVTRRPTAKEVELSLRHLKTAPSALEGLRDLQHALLNSNEFLLRH